MKDREKRGIRGKAAVAAISGFGGLMVLTPAEAAAATSEQTTSVATYTATATAMVILLFFAMALGIRVAHGFRLIASEQQPILQRRLRVFFGGAFLLAAVTPYVALSFSINLVFPFVAGAGLIVAAWVWGSSKVELELELES